jgi:NhaB family Na+:H+ antiporter
MVWMALPYTITMTLVGLVAAYVLLAPATSVLYDLHLIQHHMPNVENSLSGH